jgi:hypothetical protein
MRRKLSARTRGLRLRRVCIRAVWFGSVGFCRLRWRGGCPGRFVRAARFIFTARVVFAESGLSRSRLSCRLGVGRCRTLISDFRRRQFDGRRPSACFVVRLACHAVLKPAHYSGNGNGIVRVRGSSNMSDNDSGRGRTCPDFRGQYLTLKLREKCDFICIFACCPAFSLDTRRHA